MRCNSIEQKMLGSWGSVEVLQQMSSLCCWCQADHGSPQFSVPNSKLQTALVRAAQLQPQSKNHLPAVTDAKNGGWYFLFYSTAQISNIECSYLHSYLPNLSSPKVILLFFE